MVRMIGAGILVVGCGSFGCLLGYHYRREEQMLRWLLAALQEMEWELKYRITPLPDLCRVAAEASGGKLRELFLTLERELRSYSVSEISGCMNGLLQKSELPSRCRYCLKNLGSSLGRYDLEGQILGIQSVCSQCRQYLIQLQENRSDRLRSYQTLALCAGSGLAIILI